MEPTRFYPLLETPATCVSCGRPGPRALHVYPVNHNKPRVTRQIHLALMGCERCGLVFSHPAPTQADLDAYYGRAGEGWDARIPVDPGHLERRLARKRQSASHDYVLLQANARLPEAPRRALDFGCGIGGWLDVLAADGWETFGIEPGKHAASVAGARHAMLEDIPAEPRFGFVVVHHTLEHLPDPLAVLRQLAGATAEGGLLAVSVPNFDRLGDHRDFVYIASDKHLCSFTAAALRSLFALAGFELVADSNAASWQTPIEHPHAGTRLAAIGRRTAATLALPDRPLAAAVDALKGYAASRSEPQPRPPLRLQRTRRLVRQLLP